MGGGLFFLILSLSVFLPYPPFFLFLLLMLDRCNRGPRGLPFYCWGVRTLGILNETAARCCLVVISILKCKEDKFVIGIFIF